MLKERRILPVSSSSCRVSPYPLRSSRNKKQKEAGSPLEAESVSEWEDVRCVICMEPPHNAVLLQCSSFSKGCRAYMCDTTSRHSNCYKQYRRRNNTTRCNAKPLNCPYCRGEVFGTIKSTTARRFMNAKPRTCSQCHFSGTFAQLKTHLKADHPGFITPKLGVWDPEAWDQLEREAEYIELHNARNRWELEQRVLANSLHQLPYRHPIIDLNFDAFMQNLLSAESRVRTQASTSDFPPHMSLLEFHAPIHPRWAP